MTLDPLLRPGARARLAAQHGRLDDLQEEVLGPGPAHLASAKKCGGFEVIGSEREFRRSEPWKGWEEFEGHSPHRPWIDAVKIGCPSSAGLKISRTRDVGNPWLDAGIVLILHASKLPRTTETTGGSGSPPTGYRSRFPGQFRNWFYSLLTMSAALEQTRSRASTVLQLCPACEMRRARRCIRAGATPSGSTRRPTSMGVDDAMRWIYAAALAGQDNLNFGYGHG